MFCFLLVAFVELARRLVGHQSNIRTFFSLLQTALADHRRDRTELFQSIAAVLNTFPETHVATSFFGGADAIAAARQVWDRFDPAPGSDVPPVLPTDFSVDSLIAMAHGLPESLVVARTDPTTPSMSELRLAELAREFNAIIDGRLVIPDDANPRSSQLHLLDDSVVDKVPAAATTSSSYLQHAGTTPEEEEEHIEEDEVAADAVFSDKMQAGQ